MNFKLKTSRVISVISVLVLLIFVLSVAIVPGKLAEKNEIDWVDVATLNVEPKVPEIIEEEEEDTASYQSETVILTRSSNIKKASEQIEISTPEIPEDMMVITIDGEDIYVVADEDYTYEDDVLTTTADDLVKWAYRAYYEDWEYVYGGCEEGYVDCSGLIKSKVEVCARGTEELLAESPLSGPIETIPDIPGLGVYTFGHVGIYVGDGMVIDARTEAAGIGYDTVEYETWTNWFEIKGVDYSRYINSGSE
ncbi:hypothetical protein SAMN04487760_106183 [Lachnospiraceae bacterium G41]|nr:hypothetical protein SAMN04487760_106183 [Lachnospiraceae bacterium G41]